MLTLTQLQNLIAEEANRRQQIRRHLEAVLELLDCETEEIADTKPEALPAPATARSPEKRRYIEKIVALLRSENHPMSPAELRDHIRKELPSTTREALERAIWLELRKDKPRLARLGEGKYGLPEWRYRWITDGALAK